MSASTLKSANVRACQTAALAAGTDWDAGRLRQFAGVLACAWMATFAQPVLADDRGDEALPVATLGVIEGPEAPIAPEVITRDEAGGATVRAVRIADPLHVDGGLDERVYKDVPAIDGFIQQEPTEGNPATEKTEVWVLFDDETLYVSARCWDSDMGRLSANEMRRDNFNIFNNDHFAVILDTFYDRRNGFLFYTNPLGALADSQVTDERNSNSDWNTVWDVHTGRFPGGWSVEMAIPFKSLRYKGSGSQLWGINFRRVVRRTNEWTYLTRIPAAFRWGGLTRLSQAATLVGVETPARSMNLEFKPYTTAGTRTDLTADESFENDLNADIGFDVKYGVTKSLVADFTYNTDFAQVEADDQQVNLTRFSLFFPEKREFFLEGQGIFGFGGGSGRRFGGPSDMPILFFSRRIGLSSDGAVPIQAGGRLTGRSGKYTVGLLNIQTSSVQDFDVPTTNFSVARIKRDILRRSNIGIIATHRSQSVDYEGANSVFGFDANFNFYQNLSLGGYYARSRTEVLTGDNDSYRAALNYGSDRYGARLSHLWIGEDFNPEMGFLRRRDVRKTAAELRFSPRPRGDSAVRKHSYEAKIDYFTDGGGQLISREAEFEYAANFNSGDRLSVSYRREFERLIEDFDITDDVTIPIGPYSFSGIDFGVRLAPQRLLSGWMGLQLGDFFGGTRREVSYEGRVELSPRFSVEPGIAVNWVDLPFGSFTANLVSTRVNYTVSPRTLLAALVQYNSASQSVSTNIRFRKEYQPGSDLYIVYSDGRDTLARGFPALENRSLVVKFTRLFRF